MARLKQLLNWGWVSSSAFLKHLKGHGPLGHPNKNCGHLKEPCNKCSKSGFNHRSSNRNVCKAYPRKKPSEISEKKRWILSITLPDLFWVHGAQEKNPDSSWKYLVLDGRFQREKKHVQFAIQCDLTNFVFQLVRSAGLHTRHTHAMPLTKRRPISLCRASVRSTSASWKWWKCPRSTCRGLRSIRH